MFILCIQHDLVMQNKILIKSYIIIILVFSYYIFSSKQRFNLYTFIIYNNKSPQQFIWDQ